MHPLHKIPMQAGHSPSIPVDVANAMIQTLGLEEQQISIYRENGQIKGYLLQAQDALDAEGYTIAFNAQDITQTLAVRGRVDDKGQFVPAAGDAKYSSREDDKQSVVFIKAGGALEYNQTGSKLLQYVAHDLRDAHMQAISASMH